MRLMEETVTARLEKTLVTQIDNLVESGQFTSRSEAIRYLLSKGLNDILKVDLMKDLVDEIEDEKEITDEELFEISAKIFDRPISEILSEQRER
jgi:Arc/MetJ-type ribon-helix-helix transcriptional regulator